MHVLLESERLLLRRFTGDDVDELVELVVDQVNGVSAVKQAHLRVLHERACGLRAGFKTFRIGWVPREWNLEADQLVGDALALVP
jgi:hypothetical protein